jgi:hypothetical protein
MMSVEQYYFYFYICRPHEFHQQKLAAIAIAIVAASVAVVIEVVAAVATVVAIEVVAV